MSGGWFGDESVSVLIGGVECAGNETGLLECPHVAGTHEAVADCDPRDVAAVACQGKHFLVHTSCVSHKSENNLAKLHVCVIS